MEKQLRILFFGGTEREQVAYKHILESYATQQYQIHTSNDFSELLNTLDKEPWDCILYATNTINTENLSQLTDIKMKAKRLPILLLVNQDDPNITVSAIGAGATSYIAKPSISAESLHTAICEAINKIAYQEYTVNRSASPQHLPTQQQFMEILAHTVTIAKHRQRLMALLMIEVMLDDPSQNLTKTEQEKVMLQVGKQIATIIRHSDTISYIEDNKVGIILHDVNKLLDTNIVGTRIFEKTRRIIPLENKAINISLAIGAACYPPDGNTAIVLWQNAEAALAIAKVPGKNKFQAHTLVVQQNSHNIGLLVSDLYHAIDRNELYLRFQPIFNLKTFEVIAIEALLRWDHPAYGTVAPNDFIPYAEKSGLIIPIGHWVLDSACRQFREWIDKGISPHRMLVNVSALQLRQPHFAKQLLEILAKHSIPPERFGLELTDIALMDNLHHANQTLGYLQAFGVQISIDDFGSGFSSLSYFETLPANTIKIDHSYISGVPDSPKDTAIVTSVITLTENFGVGVIAEGVETNEQLQFLLNHGCDYGQGYLLCRPLLADDLLEYLKAKQFKPNAAKMNEHL